MKPTRSFLAAARLLLAGGLVAAFTAGAATDLTGLVKAKDGQPVAGAGVFIHTAGPRVGTSPFCPSCYADCRKRARSDSQGGFAIPELDDALLFRVLVVARGFQPAFISKVDPAMGPMEAVLTPLNAAALTPRHQLRGRVLGPDQQPLANAVVNFQMYHSGDGGRGGNVPGFDPLAVTDEAGDFLLTGDKPFDTMDVTVEALGFAKKHFHRLPSGTKPNELAVTLGGSVSGRVLLDGKPLGGVAMGMVSVSRIIDEYAGNFEFAAQPDGRFLFVNLPPNQDYFIYGLVDSLKPFGAIPSKKIRVNGDGSTTDVGDLIVQPGVRLAGQVVLADNGKFPPHTKLSVSLQDAWDSQVTELGADGRFDFHRLPPGPVSVNTRVAGYRFAGKNASLNPLHPVQIVGRLTQDKTNLLVLLEPGPDLKFGRSSYSSAEEDRLENRPLRGAETVTDPGMQHIVTGRVLDAETKSPIAAFKLTPGREVVYPGVVRTVPPPARPPNWEAHRAAEGTDGKFTMALERRASRPVLKVEAPGYLPVASPPLEASQTSYDFELKRGAGPQGRVVFPDGKPAALVGVLLLEETEQGHLRAEGRLETYGLRNPLAATDADGRFAFPPRLGATLVAVAHERGFARATAQELAAQPELVLQPWGRLTGKLLAQGKPVANERLTVTFVRSGGPYQPWLHLGLSSTTTSDGTFAFDRVPSGELQLVVLVPVASGPGAGRSWSHSPQRDVAIKPGETLALEVEKNSGGSQRFFPSARKQP